MNVKKNEYAGISDVKQEQILRALLTIYPEIQTKRWKPAFLAAMPVSDEEWDSPEQFKEMVMRVPFIPDGFVIEVEPRDLIFFEVEIHSPMSGDKLRAYGKFAIDLAAYDVHFSVISYNKYGHCNVVELLPYYADWLSSLESGRFLQ